MTSHWLPFISNFQKISIVMAIFIIFIQYFGINNSQWHKAATGALTVNDIRLQLAPWGFIRLTEKTSISNSWSSPPPSGSGILWASWRISCRRRSDKLKLSNGRSPDIFNLDKNSSQSDAKLRLRYGINMN